MKVILLETVKGIGAIGEVVGVKEGFARNFLLPRHKALRATAANLKVFEAQKEQILARNAAAKAAAEGQAAFLDGKSFVVIRQAVDSGVLYGTVARRDVAEMITEAGSKIYPNQVILDTPIKTLGIHTLTIRLHSEVSITVLINVARSEDQAVRQAAGESFTKWRDLFEEEPPGPASSDHNWSPLLQWEGLESRLQTTAGDLSIVQFDGVYRSDPTSRIALIRQGVPATDAKKLIEVLKVPQSEILRSLKLSPATLNRKASANEKLSPEDSERLLGLARILGQARTMVLNARTELDFDVTQWVMNWLSTPIPALGGRMPGEYMDTIEGQTLVSNLLSQIESGAYV